jgi:hypothetical protein
MKREAHRRPRRRLTLLKMNPPCLDRNPSHRTLSLADAAPVAPLSLAISKEFHSVSELFFLQLYRGQRFVRHTRDCRLRNVGLLRSDETLEVAVAALIRAGPLRARHGARYRKNDAPKQFWCTLGSPRYSSTDDHQMIPISTGQWAVGTMEFSILILYLHARRTTAGSFCRCRLPAHNLGGLG